MRHRFIVPAVAAAALLIAAAAPARADVKAGVDAWQAGRFDDAVGRWRPLADKGDADAQFNMGQAYRFGKGVAPDIKIARNWFQRAAAQGHERAQSSLGLILYEAGEKKAALPWLRKASDRGDPRAQYVVGIELFNADLLPKDWPRAYALMTQAAAAGLPHAANSVVEMDKHIPLAERQRGIALARQSVAGPGVPASAPSASASVTAKPPAPAAKAPAPRPAAPAPAPKAAAATPAVGGWRVQLGAYGSRAAAQGQWTAIAKKVPALSGLTPSYEAAGNFTRLRAGPVANRAAADRLCAAAKAAGQACFTVAP
jgi:cell division septation protein DedD